MPALDTYFVAWKGRRDGPYSLEELAEMLERGEIGLLHRVETSSGLVPLRQLLLQADPARWGNFSGVPAPTDVPASAEDSGSPAPSHSAAASMETTHPQEAMRVYAMCGLCFLFPPLAFWAWKSSKSLAAQGYQQTAERLKWMSIGLAAGGILLWLLLWRLW